ncbi:MAG TPA: transglycosylase family protein [Acidimicrobiales bacterium]|nr:transglycosylase family protein [Acidimicrobiales bacterium]
MVLLVTGATTAPASPVSEKQEQAARLASDLDGQAQRIRTLDSRYRRAQAELETHQEALVEARHQLDEATRLQSETRQRLVRHAQDAYALGGSLFRLSNLWRSHGGEDVVARRFYLDIVNGLERNIVDQLKAAREDLDARRADLETAEAKARAEAEALQSDKRALEQAFAKQDANLRQVKGELASLVAAEQARRDAAARKPIVVAAKGPAPVLGGGEAPGGIWDCIRQLESGNNYSSPGGGAYQFTDETWHALGQTGTAGDASPALQDAMALQLQSERGFQPWTTAPRCGRAV